MKRYTLGKIFIFFLMSITILFADVTASINPPAIYKGEPVNFTISATGENIEFPKIDSIEGFSIIGTSSSQSISMINTVITKTISKTYSFRPTHSITVPSYKVKIDGKIYNTKELKLKVLEPSATKKGDDFIIELKTNKKEAFVGEDIDLYIIFKRKISASVDKIQIGEPKIEDFWIKKVNGIEKGIDGEYITQKIHYKLFPQKAGNFKIARIQGLIGKRVQQQMGFFDDPFWGENLDWKRIYSNEINLKISSLPNGVELYGKYSIDAKVDKKKIQANRPVNLTISIKGEGNIDDIKKFTPDIPNAVVYADEPKIDSKLVNGKYQGEFKEKIAIIADSNFTIEPFELKYFDKDSKKVKAIYTKPIEVEVVGGEKKSQSSIQMSPKIKILKEPLINKSHKEVVDRVITKVENWYLKYIFLVVGYILGLATLFGFCRFRDIKRKKELPIIKAIKKAKSDKDLFKILLPYAKDSKFISNTLNKLEDNIYRGAKHKIDKDELIEEFYV